MNSYNINGSQYNEDYYEKGLEKGISLYTNYRWIPERSMREAHWFIHHMNINIGETIIDFGCAKGFFIKALRILGYESFGLEISEYAIKHAEDQVKEFIFKDTLYKFNYGLCKDVLEHCTNLEELNNALIKIKSLSDRWLIIVPLAKDNKYIIPLYENDITHKLRLTKKEWIDQLKKAGFGIKYVKFSLFGFKEKWDYLKGNIFIQTN